MEKRDFIQAEIEKLGYFLQRLLTNFLNGNSAGNSIDAADLVTNEFKNELNFDLPHYISLSPTEMKKYLANFKFTERHLELLSNLLVEMNLSKKYLIHAIELLDLVDEISNSYSFERNNKKIKIQQLLNQ